MKPYYNEDGILVYQGNCFDILQGFENHKFDLILTDIPYGTSACPWDKMPDLDKLWELLKPLGKDNAAYVFTASQPFTSKLVMSNLDWFRYEWIWDKHIARGMSQAKYQPMRKHENVLVFSKAYPLNYHPIMVKRDKPVTVKNYQKKDESFHGQYKDNTKKYTYTHKNPVTIIVDCWEANKGKVHPTQKPVALMEYLVKTYTNEGDLVLDPFSGSFTTAIACKNLRRNFIGCEIQEKYCKIGIRRLNKT